MNSSNTNPPNRQRVGPPRWAERLLTWLHPSNTLEEVAGDLDELYVYWYRRAGKNQATWHYLLNVLSVLPPFVLRRHQAQVYHKPNLLHPDMLGNYIKIARRNLLKNKVYSFINMTGLSLGLASCMLILLYTKDEISFDGFHQKKDQLYQLIVHRIGTQNEDKHFAIAAMIQGPTFKREIPEIQDVVRVNQQGFIVRKDNQTFTEKGTWVDQNFFSVFSFPLLSGNAGQVLSDPRSVVLTEQMAQKYFGTLNVVGKTLEVEMDGQFEAFTITGVAKKAPQNSSIKFNLLFPFAYLEARHPDNGWMWVSYPTYLVLNPKAKPSAVVAKMARVFARNAKSELAQNKLMGYTDRFIWGMQPFLKMHLNTEFEGTPEASNPLYSYILTGLAVLILLIACINFVNLTVAQSLKRSKEIGIRKVMGSQRSQLVRQFFGESLLICCVAFVFALLLAQLGLPFFNEVANKQLQLTYLLDPTLVASYVGLLLVTGITAGLYPALIVSRATPAQTLYGRFKVGGKDYIAKGLVVIQFALATFLILSTGFIYRQFAYLTQTDLGYNDKNLLELTIDKAILNPSLMAAAKAEFAAIPGVEGVAIRNVGQFGGPTQAAGKEVKANYEHVDEAYLPTLQMPLLSGRNFSSAFPADSLQSLLINEAFAKAVGWKNPIGQTIDYMNLPGWGSRKMHIVGLVRDYHGTTLREKIQPQVFTMESSLPLGRFLIRLKPTSIPQTLKALEQVYQRVMPNHPFQYSFKEESNQQNYEAEAKWKQIITLGTLLTIFISCMGLFGLTMLSIQQRTKEIAVRKVLGASSLTVSVGLVQQFLGLIALSFVLATPAAWYTIHRWLENYAYKIELSWPIFAITAGLIMVLSLLTIGFHVLQAARANPALSLRKD